MFPNLNAEQARRGLTNEETAAKLGITRTAYEGKKKRGTFRLSEIRLLCELFGVSFEYLFEEAAA